MGWETIKGEGVRNLHPFKINPAQKISFFWGENGAGKTSILEAICFLSTGRSFRGKTADAFISADLSKSILFGKWFHKETCFRIGLQRDRKNNLVCHLNGAKQQSLQQNNQLFGVKVLTPDIFSVVAGKADQRRNLLDWPLFHVEHLFRKTKSNLNRVLKQRNAVLRSFKNKKLTAAMKNEIQGWNSQLVSIANELHQHREKGAEELETSLLSMSGEPGEWIKKQNLSVVYQSGWPKGKNLQQVLDDSLERDLLKGYTHYGPHRFDLTLFTNKSAVAEVFSRGELKTLAVASQICQINKLVENKQQVVVLLDDLFAELDSTHSDWCLEQLTGLTGVQTFVTGINIPKRIKQRFLGKGIGWFHVEHGRIIAE